MRPIRGKEPRDCAYQEQEPGDCLCPILGTVLSEDINQVAKPVVAAGAGPSGGASRLCQAEHLEASACMVLLSLHHRLAVR